MSFVARNLGFAYGLEDVSFELPQTGLVAIAGPNGAGKSTLLGILARLRTPYRGSIQFDGREIRQWAGREFARRVTFLPQSLRIEFPFTAYEVILMGRTPHASGWFESSDDRDAAERAMQTTDALAFRDRDFRSLSGGERQRVLLASALAQKPQVLLLDEPATFLDLKHQLASYRVLVELSKTTLVLAVTHDLNVALQFASRVLVLDSGRLAADGAPFQALQTDTLRRVFGVQSHLHFDDRGTPWLSYEA